MASNFRQIEGVGLFTGAPCRVRLEADGAPGVRLALGGREGVLLGALAVVGTDRRVALGLPGEPAVRVELVEHLLAAVGGLGVRDGLLVTIDGPELPLLDGGAVTYAALLQALGLRTAPPRLRVVRPGVVTVDTSRYELAPAPASAPHAVLVEVEVEFDAPGLTRHASWHGDGADFVARVAPARTFALAREIEALAARGMAAHADPASVLVLDDAGVRGVGSIARDEPARHKLLDLIGDATYYGGPPLGVVRATRPGHAASHRAFTRALAEGILVDEEQRARRA